ncbi:MAG: metal-dependent transcriptional regulator [Candidatus Hodarchaeaceae archaeon]|nr:metal-dependent transcriptional regulator [Candidatus Hodarchaeaceae archaeon]
MITESIEEYLEAIFRLREQGEAATTTSVAKELKVAPASATQMLKKLAKQGYLKYTPYHGVTLTPKGEKIGKKILRKHRVMQKFLNTMGLPKSRVHKNACELEHHISDDLEQAIYQRVESERPLPPGIPRDVTPITSLLDGRKGIISHISGGRGASQRLADLGLTPGTEVMVVKSAIFHGPLMVRVRGTTLAIGRGLASKIFVRTR